MLGPFYAIKWLKIGQYKFTILAILKQLKLSTSKESNDEKLFGGCITLTFHEFGNFTFYIEKGEK